MQIFSSSGFNSNPIGHFTVNELQKYGNLLLNRLSDNEQKTYLSQIKVRLIAANLELEEISLKTLNGWEKLKHDHPTSDIYLINPEKDLISIIGSSPQSVLYGMYDLLQLWGIRWFFPGKKYEEIPSVLNHYPLTKIKSEYATFAQRGLILSSKVKGFLAWLDFAAKHRMNIIGVEDSLIIERLSIDAEQRGIELILISYDFPTTLCSQEGVQLPLSERCISNYRKHIPRYQNEIFLFPPKTFNHRCKCLEDKNIPWSDQYLLQLNTLMDKFPPLTRYQLNYYANSSSWKKPLKSTPYRNINLVLDPNHRCFSHSIADPFCRWNSQRVKNVEDQLTELFKDNQIFGFDYWLDPIFFGEKSLRSFSNVAEEKYGRIPNNFRVVQKDLLYYYSRKISRIMSYARNLDEDYLKKFLSPLIYFYPQLLWNPTIDLHTALTQFCKEYLGSDQISSFFDENELMDPMDMTTTQFIGVFDIASHRYQLLQKYYQQITSPKIKNRIRLLMEEQQQKLNWRIKFWVSRIIKIIKSFLFILQQKYS